MSGAAPAIACAFCGLPVPRSLVRRRTRGVGDDAPQYCCYGCSFAQAVAGDRGDASSTQAMLLRLGVAIFFTMNVMVFSMELWTLDVYGDGPAAGASELAAPLADLFRYLCLVLSLPVLWLLGLPIAANAWRNLRRGGPATDLLMVVGVAAAIGYSAISVLRGSGHLYFEVGCTVLVMVTLGRWFEATGKQRTSAALDALEQLLPARVRVLCGGREHEASPADVRVGDLLRVLAGERFALDGVVLAGNADVDQQVLTGESRPVAKGPGDAVLGGSLNLDGALVVRVSAELQAGTIQRLIDAVREARQSRGYYQRLADRVSAWFLPLVTVVAFVTLAWHTAAGSLEQGLLAALAVLLIACPCALGLATPMAVWAAIGRASQAQVLVRSGEALERLAAVRAICFDKTGTLTTGAARVARFVAEDPSQSQEVLRRAVAIAASSGHHLARAIGTLPIDGDPLPDVQPRTLPGRGLSAEMAEVGGVYLGNLRLMDEAGLVPSAALRSEIDAALAAGSSIVCLGWSRRVRGLFVFQEDLRADSPAALDGCRELGLHVAALTGDHALCGRGLARQLDIEVAAELLPHDKVAAIARLRERFGPVAMVGDGINDAPAMAASDVGLAMGCGADVSREAAAVCLLGNQVARVPWTVLLARQTVRVVRQNLFWAFAYNVVGVGLACAGWLNPIWAALAMVASSVLVVGNSLRLAHFALPIDAAQRAEGAEARAEFDAPHDPPGEAPARLVGVACSEEFRA